LKDVNMTTTHTAPTSPTARGRRLLGVALTVCSLILFTSGAALAQDNDDDGVLPGHGGSAAAPGQNGAPGSGSSGSASTGVSVGTQIGIAGPLEDGLIDGRRAALQLSTAAGGTDVAFDVDSQDATFTGDVAGLNVSVGEDAVRLQGSGTLSLHTGVAAAMVRAQHAFMGWVFLVLDDGQASLKDTLAGKTQPDLIVSLGNLWMADLVVFQRILSHHAADLPGVHATLVFVSMDPTGAMHYAAVRGSTAGDSLEVAIP
jgi:hypothetical protein